MGSHSSLKQLPVSNPCRPFGPGEMAVEGMAGAIGIVIRINVQDDPGYFLPVGAVRLAVEHAPVGDGVLLVVNGQHWA